MSRPMTSESAKRPPSSSPALPLDTLGSTGMGEEDMMNFINTHIESILKPYAENVIELHKTVLDLSSNVCAFEEKCGVMDTYFVRMDVMHEELENVKQFADKTRQFLDGFIDESGKITQESEHDEQQDKAIKSLKECLTLLKEEVEESTAQNAQGTLSLFKKDLDELQKNCEDMRTKLGVCQDAENENRSNCVELKSELQRVADNLKSTDETQAATIQKVDSHKGLLDTETRQNKDLAQEQRYLRAKFIALDDETADRLKTLSDQYAENRSQLKQYRKEFEQARDEVFGTQSLLGVNDELGRLHKETKANFDRINNDVMSQVRAMDEKSKDLRFSLSSDFKLQSQQLKDDMKKLTSNVGDLEALTSKHETEVTAIQTVMTVLRPGFDKLQQEAYFADKRCQRVEDVLGLPPMTKEDLDPKKGLRKKASSMMLTDDQLTRKAFTAWIDGIKEDKQNQLVNALPKIQETLKTQNDLLESEKSKLHSTNDKVQILELDHNKLQEEVQKLRKSLELNDGYWKGMTRGLQVAKKTMHTEGDGEMVPSATRLRNALPPLTGLTPRPATTSNIGLSSSLPTPSAGTSLALPAPSLK